MFPELLRRHFGTVLEEANAYIVAPSEATHRPEQGAHSTIDNFVVCGTLKEHIADVAVDQAYGVSRHRAVRITRRTTKQNMLVEEV